MPRKYNNMQERLIANSVHATDSAYEGSWCWLWVAKSKRNRAGVAYPVVSVREGGKVRAKLAHRVSVEAFTGVPLTPGFVAKHLCNNSLCVNPAHLEGGTQRENLADAREQGRQVRDPATGCYVALNYVFNSGHVDAFRMEDEDRHFVSVSFPEEWYEGRSALNA